MPGTRRKKNNQHTRFATRHTLWATASALSLLLPAASAWADGQIKFKVVDSRTGKLLPGAVIVIKAGPRDLDDSQFNTSSVGVVTTGDLDSGERSYTARALVNGISYKVVSGKITVVDNQTVDVEIKLEAQGEIVQEIKAKQLRLDVEDPGIYTFRDREHLQFFPNAIGNSQSLNKAFRSVPGMVPDSQNRLHSRGEADTGTFYIDGFQLPSLLAGRATQLLTPAMLESLKVRTGNLGANFGGGSTVLETSLRPGIRPGSTSTAPHFDYSFGSEEYGGNFQNLTFSRQTARLGRNKDPRQAPAMAINSGVVLSYSRRQTDNFLESPQPNRQLANNSGTSETLFGKLTQRLSPKMDASLLVGSSVSHNGIANRRGLGDAFANRGQGFGFGGNKNATDFPRVTFQDGTNFAANQETLGNKVGQTDNQQFYVVQIMRAFSQGLNGTFSVGGVDSGQGTTTSNRLAYPRSANTGVTYSPATMVPDYSIEYNPTTGLKYSQSQIQADFVLKQPESRHAYKFGVLAQSLTGNESYLFAPMSNTALSALLNSNPYVGSSFRANNSTNFPWPTMLIRRSGGYSALYAQDTFTASSRLRLDVGVRVENFDQKQVIGFAATDPRAAFNTKRSEGAVSPRFGALMQFPNGLLKKLTKGQPTVLRLGYNKIFTPPGIGQGAIGFGQTGATPLPVAPQTNNQFDFSLDQQLSGRSLHLAAYNKDIKNALGWQQMVQGPQAGAFMMVNQGAAKVNGFEVLYEIKPRNLDQRLGALDAIEDGVSGYISYTSSNVKRSALLGAGMVPQEFDQQQTLNVGLGYQLKNKAQAALTFYHGSGLRSSVTTAGGSRAPIDQLDLRLRSQPRLIGRLHAIELGVENLTNSRSVLNFSQGAAAVGTTSFGGTRFQQGRRMVLSLTGKF